MSSRYTVEADLDGTIIRLKAPPTADHRVTLLPFLAGVAVLAGLTYAWNVYWVSGMLAVGAGVLLLRILTMAPPLRTYTMNFSGARVIVNEKTFDVGRLKVTYNKDKIVFRDDAQQEELWHGIRDLNQRMELRNVMEAAVDRARERHGAGGDEIPEELRNVSPEARREAASSRE